MGLTPLDSLEDLGCDAETVAKLEQLYGNGKEGIERIDLLVGTLGPENAQLYRTVAGHAMNQLAEFPAAIFEVPPVAPKPTEVLVTPYPSQSGSPPAGATLEQKARSYLQANCAHCHRPNDGFIMSPFPNFDLRYTTALKDAKICFGIPGSPP